MTTMTPIPALQLGSRLRLNDDQRALLRTAYQAASIVDQRPIPGKGISVETARHTPSLNAQLGMDKMTFSSLIASRDSLAIPLLLRFQEVLGVTLVTEADLKESFKSYIQHLKTNHGLK
jgi:hypothetical protein